MAGGEGGIGGVDPGGGSGVVRGRIAAAKAAEAKGQLDAAQVAMARRRRALAPIGAPASGPTTTATTEKHVLQSDFTTVSATTMALPVEVVRDTDGRMTFFASQSPKCVEWFDDMDTVVTGRWQQSHTGASAGIYYATDHISAAECAIGEYGFTTGTTSTGRASIYAGSTPLILGTFAVTVRWRCTLGALSTVTDEFIDQFGLLDNPTANAEPANGAYITYRRTTDGDFWVCVTRDNSSETKTVTSVSPADYSTLHTFEVAVNQAGTSCVFKIDGTTVATHTTNIPTAAGRRVGLAFKHYKTAGTTARYAYLDYCHFSATRTTDR